MSANSGMIFEERKGIKGTQTKPQQPPHLYGPSRPFGSDIKLANPNYFGVATLKQVRKGAYKNIYMKNSFQNILRPLAGGGGGMGIGDRGGLHGLTQLTNRWGSGNHGLISGINPDGTTMGSGMHRRSRPSKFGGWAARDNPARFLYAGDAGGMLNTFMKGVRGTTGGGGHGFGWGLF